MDSAEKTYLVRACHRNFSWWSWHIEKENIKFCSKRDMDTNDPPAPILYQALLTRVYYASVYHVYDGLYFAYVYSDNHRRF